jgi:hypothetical protein
MFKVSNHKLSIKYALSLPNFNILAARMLILRFLLMTCSTNFLKITLFICNSTLYRCNMVNFKWFIFSATIIFYHLFQSHIKLSQQQVVFLVVMVNCAILVPSFPFFVCYVSVQLIFLYILMRKMW